MPKLVRLIGTTLGGTTAGPAGALLGGLAAAGLECLFPAGGMVQQTVGDFTIDAIRSLGQRMQPGLPDGINADLQRAFHAALVPALYDLGGRPCFPQPWHPPRDVPEELPLFHQPQAAHRLQQHDPSAQQACELLHTLVAQAEQQQLLPAHLSPELEAAYRQAQTLDDLARLFFDHGLLPVFDQPAWADLRREWPEVEQHLRRYLFGRVLVHLNEFLKQDTESWRAFTRLLLEGTRAALADLAHGQADLARQMPALLTRLEQIQADPDALARLSSALADGLHDLGTQFSAHLDRRLDDLTTLFADHMQAVQQRLDEIIVRLERIERSIGAAPTPTRQRHQLRAPVGDFVGREQEIDQLTGALTAGANAAAICGVRGMGGIGKTELALVVANHLADRFPDGQIVVELFGASNPIAPEAALQAVIRAFEPQAKLPDDLPTLKQWYAACLTGKRVLVLADDARDAAQVRPLLPPAGCALLVTSRNTFNLPKMQRLDLGLLTEAEAVALLLDICPRIGEHAPVLAKLCGYLPLALRVSADLLATDDTRTVTRYLEQLQAERLKHLTDPDNPDDPAASVAASLALSYAALPTTAQQTFAQLGVFVGDFTLAAAAAVLALPDPQSPLPDTLGLLRRRSLLDYDTASERYDLHDLVRAFALDHLTAAGDEDATRLRHARYYEELISYAQDELYLKGKVSEGLALFDHERRQFDVAWQWVQQQSPAHDTDKLLIQFEGAVYAFANMRYDARHDRVPHLQALLEASRRLNDKFAEGAALGNLGLAYADLGEYHRAIEYHEQALVISREIGDRRGEGSALGNLGSAYADLGEYPRAIDYYEQHLVIAREIGDRRGEGAALGNLGLAYADLGDTHRAIDFYEQHLVIAREIGDRRGEGNALGNLGNAYADLGEYPRAIDFYEQALVIARAIGDRRGEGNALGNLGIAYADLGEYPRAIDYYEQRLVIARAIGDRRGEGAALGNLGSAYRNLGEYQRAIEYYEQRLNVGREIGDIQGEAIGSWNLGLLYEAQGDLARAVPLVEHAAAFMQQIGHAVYAQQYSDHLNEIRQKLAAQGG